MPTKKKRVGFIPREVVMKILDKLSFENNLSNSKIISILVEEALAKRGIYNIETGKEYKSNEEIYSTAKSNLNIYNNEKTHNQNKNITNNKNLNNKITKQNFQDKFDLQTYEKFLLFLKFQEMTDNYEA